MMETIALSNNIVVIGKKNLNPGRSMTMSPGNLNSGSVLTHDQERPSRIRIAPKPTSTRFIDVVYVFPDTSASPLIQAHEVAFQTK